jgi:hypothetical protein
MYILATTYSMSGVKRAVRNNKLGLYAAGYTNNTKN